VIVVTEDRPIPTYNTVVARDGRFDRRAFLQAALAAAAAAGLGCGRNGTPWRFFTVEEARTLAAISEQIIPADHDHGAAWAGVVNYIDRQLCGAHSRFQDVYQQGIAAIDANCRSRYSATFADLDSERQIDFLHRLESNQVDGDFAKQVSPAEFFGLVVDHTMQGFYGDPRHGGNRDGISWKMLGLPYPPIRGRQKFDLTKL